MKLLSALVLRFILLLYILPFSMFLAIQLYLPTIRTVFGPESYVAEIKGDPILVNITKDALENIDMYTPVNIIRSTGKRPITIELVDDFFDNKFRDKTFTVGRAWPRYTECHIELATSRLHDKVTFEDTLFHEFLHCLGYDHVDKRFDLMYKYVDIVDPSSSLRYAQEVGERFEMRDKWKTLLNLNTNTKLTK